MVIGSCIFERDIRVGNPRGDCTHELEFFGVFIRGWMHFALGVQDVRLNGWVSLYFPFLGGGFSVKGMGLFSRFGLRG